MISFVFFSHKLLMHFTVKILRNTLRIQDMSLKVLEPMNLMGFLMFILKVKYYLIHEKECFIIFKTRGAAERFRYDKTRLFECIK